MFRAPRARTNKVRPHIFRQPKHAPVTVEFGLTHERFATGNGIDGLCVKRGWHIGRRHLDELNVFDRHVRLFERAKINSADWKNRFGTAMLCPANLPSDKSSNLCVPSPPSHRDPEINDLDWDACSRSAIAIGARMNVAGV